MLLLCQGNVYIADSNNDCIRKVTVSTGIITTIVGTGTAGYSGDGGLATSATINAPYDVAVDSSGNVYVADLGNQRIRKLTISTGIITTYAGSASSCGTSPTGDGGDATSAALCNPLGVAVDSVGQDSNISFLITIRYSTTHHILYRQCIFKRRWL